MREAPQRLKFEIGARDGAARTGTIHTAHGPIETPAFIPLATKGTVRGLESSEVAGLGYELILGNTYHLFVSPGPERIAKAGGLHGFMGWDKALITDSGGFQVFSLAHGGVANEVKGSGRSGGEHGSKVEITEEGARFHSYRDGSELFISPEVSMSVQVALGSDIALVFDECTPFHADRDYTARSTERTHRWLDRCLEWHGEHGPARQAVFGIVQGGVYEDLRRESAECVAAAAVDGLAIGGTLGRDKEEMRGVLAMTTPLLPEEVPKHLLGIGEVDDLLAGIALGLDVFDCAVPTRLARHGVALVPDPEHRFRLNLRKAGWEGSRDPLVEGCPCPACRHHDRDYLSYLSRAEELTAVRLICTHNLTYMHELTNNARAAIEAGTFTAYAAAVMSGRPPWAAS
ncbi:MAG TPA: tRNA guanosine(34) transglycosylase Tgt [Solirubrobacterales bacterium]|jgi:queuine tRNA-ribosyltransferase|nr:tRNA guanosine(34) transglycosylase Tgt [Solirubrobacterales bacterium]